MTVILINGFVTKKDIEKASEDYGSYIKITADIVLETVVIGGEWHADGEKILLENGSKQSDIWGGGIDYKTKEIDFNSLINIRPGINESMEILDKDIRNKFAGLVKNRFGELYE